MSGTAVVAVKRALRDRLKAAGVVDEQIGEVAYAPPSRTDLQREHVYCGRATFNHKPMAFKGAGPLTREENATLNVHAYVCLPGGTEEDAEARAQELGTGVEEELASDPRLTVAGQDTALIITVASGEIDSWSDDDAAYAVMTYRVACKARLT